MHSLLKPLPAGFITTIPALLLLALSLSLLSCGDSVSGGDTETPEEPGEEVTPEAVTGEDAVEAMIEVLKERGLDIPSDSQQKRDAEAGTPLDYEDYMTTDVNEEDERRVHFDIGPEGHIIPTSEWRDANPDACEEENRYMKSTHKRLQFKMFARADGYNAFVQYIDAGTGKIEYQQEGEGETLEEAVNNAWDKLTITIKSPTDACGRLKGVMLYFNSRISDMGSDASFIEHVEAYVELEANAEGHYDGSGTLTYLEISSSVDGTCTFPDGTLNVRELVFAMDGDTPADSTALDIEYQNVLFGGNCSATDDTYVPHWPFNFSGLHMDEWESEDGESWDGLFIRDWEAVPEDEEVYARKEYDRTEVVDSGGGDSTTLTEKTVIEIRKE